MSVDWLATLIQTDIFQRLTKLCSDIHRPQRVNRKDFHKPLTFHLTASPGFSHPAKYLNRWKH